MNVGGQLLDQPPEIGDHLFEVREAFPVDGERPIVLLVIDVEVDDVGGDLLRAKRTRDFVDARFRIIRVARLLEPERPDWCERGLPGQVGIAGEDGLRLRARDEIVVEITPFRAEGG